MSKRVALVHDLELGLGLGPLLDALEDLLEPRQAGRRLGVVGMGLPVGLADQVADLLPHRRLGDEVDVGVGIGLPALALQDDAGLAAAGIVAGARHGIAERDALAELRVFLQRPVREALLVAQFYAAEVQDPVLHRRQHALATAGALALVERAHDAQRQMQAGARIADLRAGHQRQAVMEAGGRGRPAGTLRHVLVDLAVLVGPRAEALHRGHDHARVERMDVLPGEPHAVERARREVLDQHVAGLHQALQHLHALLALGVERDRALVVVEHGEIEAVGARHVLQLAARDVAGARPLDLDHVGAEPREKLRAGRARLDMREVEDLHAIERLAVLAPRLARHLGQAVAVCLLGNELENRLLRRLGFLGSLVLALRLLVLLLLSHVLLRSLECR